MIQLIAFYLFATIVIASAAMVIFARNPVHSVMWLILAFFNAAGLMLLVIVPVIGLVLFLAWRYRAGNASATGAPSTATSICGLGRRRFSALRTKPTMPSCR